MPNHLLTATVLLLTLSSLAKAQAQEDAQHSFARCAQCHGQQGWGDEEKRVPAIAGLPAAYLLRQFEAYRADTRKEQRMHREAVSDRQDLAEVANLISLLTPLRPVKQGPSDPGRGQRILLDLCAECHGNAGEGKPDRGAPPLTGFQAWYVTDQIRRFKEFDRTTSPGSLDADRMHAIAYKVISLEDAEDVAAFLATARTLKN
jgi:cytochrome c oxidase subunit 2